MGRIDAYNKSKENIRGNRGFWDREANRKDSVFFVKAVSLSMKTNLIRGPKRRRMWRLRGNEDTRVLKGSILGRLWPKVSRTLV